MLKLIIIYFIFQTIYVILNTVKTILTIKSTKIVASIASAITYAVYVFVLIYTVADFSIWVKAGLTAVTNFIGTYISMFIVEKLRRDKLWEITATVTDIDRRNNIMGTLAYCKIGFNVMQTSKDNEYVFHIYSKTKDESLVIKKCLAENNAHYIIHEETVRL